MGNNLCAIVCAGRLNGTPVAIKVMEVQSRDTRLMANEIAINQLLDHPNTARYLAHAFRKLVRGGLKNRRGIKRGGGGMKRRRVAV